MENLDRLSSFYKNKNVFITGHTGFKGSWLSQVLLNLGANVTGYSLLPPTNPNLFSMIGLDSKINSITGDIRDYEKLQEVIKNTKPEIVFHLAAQPLVIDSYSEPRYTYETNVMGTVNILESVKNIDSVKSFINVTTDKVYLNNDEGRAFVEDDKLCGFDPYSNSKSCSEMVTYSYYNSFFNEKNIPVSTLRAGNVIGGGDFSKNRLVPDCIKAAQNNETIIIRNPNSTRPFQHVLEPISAYIEVAMKQYINPNLCGSYNIGPSNDDIKTSGEVADIFCKYFEGAKWKKSENKPSLHEASLLTLNSTRINDTFGIKPVWNIEKAIEKTIEMSKAYNTYELIKIMNKQIEEYYVK